MRIAIGMKHYVKIFLGQEPPAIRTDSLMIFLNKVSTTFSIATARQLHHLGPLVEPPVAVAIGRVPIVAITFNRRIISLIFYVCNHFADIEVLGHYGHGVCLSFGVLAPYRNVVVAAAIAFIRKLFILIPHFPQSHSMIKRHIFTTARLLCNARGRGLRAAAGFRRATGRFCAATGFFFA